MHKTGSTTVQKSPNLRRAFRTTGRQTSILECVARPKNLYTFKPKYILTLFNEIVAHALKRAGLMSESLVANLT